MVCDILVGERGLSCKKISQIPDLKVFYVRFLMPEGEEDGDRQSNQVCCFINPSPITEMIKFYEYFKIITECILARRSR